MSRFSYLVGRFSGVHPWPVLGVPRGGRIESISHTRAGGTEHWNLEVKPDEPSWGMEISLQDLSADQIAELRARRIVLNEKRRKGRRGNDLNDTMLETFVHFEWRQHQTRST
jgi:hypothetical protein